MARDLDAAVEEMAKEGWDEEVARSALLAQREKTTGQKAPPSLQTAAPKKQAGEGKKVEGGGGGKGGEPPIKPARREDVVFEVTEAELQKVRDDRKEGREGLCGLEGRPATARGMVGGDGSMELAPRINDPTDRTMY